MALVYKEHTPSKPFVYVGSGHLIVPSFLKDSDSLARQAAFKFYMASGLVASEWGKVFHGLSSAEQSKKQEMLKRLTQINQDDPEILCTFNETEPQSDQVRIDFYF